MLVSIIGLGLIGGSIGLALREAKKPRWEVIGYSRRRETVAKALSLGAIERGASSLRDAAKQADLVVIATPVLAVKEILSEIAACVRPGCVVTDTASTKVQVMKWAEEILPPKVYFVGGHPMAGKETYGIEAAKPKLFKGCTYCLTSPQHTSQQSMDVVVTMVKKLGARPFLIDAQEHDELVAGISHLPMLLSAALVSLTTRDPRWPRMSKLAASGYHDLTRLASANPELTAHIYLTNREAILDWIEKFSEELREYGQLVARRDRSLQQALAEVSKARQEWLDQKQ